MTTATALNITRVLVLCPRGFANERNVYALTPALLPAAQALVDQNNPGGDVTLTRIYEFDRADQADQRAAQESIESHYEHINEDYEEFMEFFLSH